MPKTSLPVFGFTLFLSAALMFDLQPMVGKMLLPIVGGTPSGWIVAMAFFQIMLLAGYFVAHALSRFEPRMQGILFIACLGAGCFFLPARLAPAGFDRTPNAGDVFVLLTLVLAVPFIALSATSSTIQRLFTTTGHVGAKDPYFLYAASNFGSFAGLLLYPLLVEPRLTLTTQTRGWFYGYILLIALSVVCLLMSGNRTKPEKSENVRQKPSSLKQRLTWTFLAFIPSSLMLGVTTHISSDIISAPMIWVIPLSIYLLTFVLAFSSKCPIPLEKIAQVHPAAIALAIAGMALMGHTWFVMILHLLTFGLIAFFCHKQLANARPAAGALTEFYLFLSVGGALGGVLNAFIAPAVFSTAVEYPIVLILSGLVNPYLKTSFGKDKRDLAIIGVICLIFYVVVAANVPALNTNPFFSLLPVVSFVLFSLHPRYMIIFCTLAVLFLQFGLDEWRNMLYQERNFFGIVRVYTHPVTYNGVVHKARVVVHGTTRHGMQIADDPALARLKTTYYSEQGPLGDVMRKQNPRHVGVIGLGAGTIACYANKGRDITFYEIDPAIVTIAKKYFTFIKLCAPDTKIFVGDGRLELAKRKDLYDLLIIDAFSSDMVPSHLLTREALQVYLDHLTKHGVIAFHLSNRYIYLEKIVAATAQAQGLENRFKLHTPAQKDLVHSSKWLVLARTAADLSSFRHTEGWHKIFPPANEQPWTDDYSNIIHALTIFN